MEERGLFHNFCPIKRVVLFGALKVLRKNNVSTNYVTDCCLGGKHSKNVSVLSIGVKVDVPTGKVGSSLLFESQRRKLPRGVWGHAPTENFEI